MNGEFKPGTSVEKDELLVYSGDSIGYTIEFQEDDDTECPPYEAIVVWDDQKLRDRIVELLNKYGVGNEQRIES
jgi:hypothetical protein